MSSQNGSGSRGFVQRDLQAVGLRVCSAALTRERRWREESRERAVPVGHPPQGIPPAWPLAWEQKWWSGYVRKSVCR